MDEGMSAITGEQGSFGAWHVFTDPDGKFTWGEQFAPDSSLFISAAHVGYRTLNVHFPVAQTGLVVRLRPWRALTVRVIDKETDAPLPGVVVGVSDLDGERVFSSNAAATDRNGICRFTEVTEGWKRVRVDGPVGAKMLPDGSRQGGVRFTEDVMLTLPERTVTVKAERNRLPFHATDVAKISGRLFMPDGKTPVGNAQFQMFICEPVGEGMFEQCAWSTGVTARDGSFFFSVAREEQEKVDGSMVFATATRFPLSPALNLQQPYMIMNYSSGDGNTGYALLKSPPVKPGEKVEGLRVVLTSGWIEVQRGPSQPTRLQIQPALKNTLASKAEQQMAATGKVLFSEDFHDATL